MLHEQHKPAAKKGAYPGSKIIVMVEKKGRIQEKHVEPENRWALSPRASTPHSPVPTLTHLIFQLLSNHCFLYYPRACNRIG